MKARLLSVAQLTALPLAPPDLVQLTADAGCSACGLRLLPASPGGPYHPLMPWRRRGGRSRLRSLRPSSRP